MQYLHSVSPVEALKMSIQSEKEMRNYYNKATSVVQDEHAKSILKAFADHAEANRENSIAMYSKMSGRRILYLNLDRRHRLNTLIRCSDDPNDVIRTAKRNEKELASYYNMVARRFMDPDLRAYFRRLGQNSFQHLALLEATFIEPFDLNEQEMSEQDMVQEESDKVLS